MAYQALYRVFRPQRFADVLGQSHVTKTLQNAITQHKISHAYLFSGPRGTGKTSAAKIFAKAVNCREGGCGEPCNNCEICREITAGSLADVLEIDAASNNGVEEIRDIREKVKYVPTLAKYKIYIIDEVHMLSQGAFNALLKTLEEPPKHVIFILATTEPHKLPLTIISRLQRFDFKRITTQNLIDRMTHIMDEEKIDYEKKALMIIARAAEGGMRDALSLLDQVISYGVNKVTTKDALEITGSVAHDLLTKLVRAMMTGDVQNAVETLSVLFAEGKDAIRLVEDLLVFFRDILLYQKAPHLEESLERALADEEFQQLAHAASPEKIYQGVNLLNETNRQMRFSNHPEIHVEVAVVQLSQLNDEKNAVSTKNQATNTNIDALQEEISQLRKEVDALKREMTSEKAVSYRQTPNHTQSQKVNIKNGQSFKTSVRQVNQVLREAKKQDLERIQNCWRDLISMLMASQAALLNEAEPVAASKEAFVLKFKHEIHCQMAMDNPTFVETIIKNIAKLTNQKFSFLGIPEDQWFEVRDAFINKQGASEAPTQTKSERVEDTFISEAAKLVGEDLLEIKE